VPLLRALTKNPIDFDPTLPADKRREKLDALREALFP
jgi:hypothetical protein